MPTKENKGRACLSNSVNQVVYGHRGVNDQVISLGSHEKEGVTDQR